MACGWDADEVLAGSEVVAGYQSQLGHMVYRAVSSTVEGVSRDDILIAPRMEIRGLSTSDLEIPGSLWGSAEVRPPSNKVSAISIGMVDQAVSMLPLGN